MRSTSLALIMGLGFVAGELEAATAKTLPADVGPGRVAWFDISTTSLPRAKELGGTVVEGFPFNLPDGIGAIAVALDASGHPVGLYSRTPLPAPRSPSR